MQGVRRWLERLKLILSPAHNLLIMQSFTRYKDPEYLPILGIKRLLVSRGWLSRKRNKTNKIK